MIGKDFLTVHKKVRIIKEKTKKLNTSVPLKISFREDYNKKMIIFKDREVISTIFNHFCILKRKAQTTQTKYGQKI